MAIQVDTALSNGLTINAGYFKIERVSLNNTTGSLYFSGALYANKQARLDNKEPVVQQYYSNSFKADKEGNLLEQAYNYIKLLAENEECPESKLFANNVDV